MPHSPQKITILYVEDDLSTRSLVESYLSRRQEFNLLSACDGKQGLELFSSNQVDIVLTDIMMPKMNGLDMARAIREISTDCQIVVMTAFSDTAYLMDAIDIGVNQFVLKPIEFKKLLIALDRCSCLVRMQSQMKIQESEIQRAKKMEAIAILAGGMAHDFNNLLQVILGYISLALCNAEPNTKIYEMLSIAERSSVEAQRLSQRLLSLARGGLFNLTRCDLRPLLKESIAIIRQYGCDVPVLYAEPESLSRVLLDAEQIHILFMNILKNADESMPDGGVITVVATDEAILEQTTLPLMPGNYVHIVISDTGVGIVPALLPDVFDPYVTTKEMGNTKGVGLGLTLCHAIVRKHKGIIYIESTVGEGTAVHIYLPAEITSP